MLKYYGVVFKKDGKSYIFAYDKNIKIGEKVIVNTEKGLQYGFINNFVEEEKLKIDRESIKEVVRIATLDDEKVHLKNLKDGQAAYLKAIKFADELGLEMKFIDAAFTFDRKQLLLNFLADDRVDFRDLAKRLASVYRTRIELRQVGARDKAREVGGIGICGRKLCCSAFLNHIDAVSMNMAKNQNIALNPAKINGCCGRLLCCLAYEDENYTECSRGLPSIGQKIDTEWGKGQVVSVDILGRKYTVDIDGDKKEVVLEDCGKCKK